MKDQNFNFYPDFLLIPYGIHIDKNLDSTDKMVFAVIYWFEHLKDGKCTASNETLALIVATTSGSVKNSLLKLENNNHISRKYKDDSRLEREYIKTNHSFRQGGGHPLVTGGSPTGAQIKNTILEKNTASPLARTAIPIAKDEDISYSPLEEDEPRAKKPNQNKVYEEVLACMAKKRSEITGEEFKFAGSRIGDYAALKAIKKLMPNKRTYEIWEEMCESEWWQEHGFGLWDIIKQFKKKGK